MSAQSQLEELERLSTYESFPHESSPEARQQKFSLYDVRTWAVLFSSANNTQASTIGSTTSTSGNGTNPEKYSLGQGQCGRVHTLPNSGTVVKTPKSTKTQQLYNDARVHQAVCEALQQHWKLVSGLSVPNFYRWVLSNEKTFWRGGVRNTGKYGLVSQRIPPVPRLFRENLVNKLCRKSLRQTSLADKENADCLIRLYLGRRNIQPKREQTSFRMRNLPLHENEMPLLGIDPAHVAGILARALAVLHWAVRTDANDVEFVLGGPPEHDIPACAEDLFQCGYDEGPELIQEDKLLGQNLRVWLLDFNQCTVAIDHLGATQSPRAQAWIQTLVDGFFWNDPYYPNPAGENEEDQVLWALFKLEYLTTSQKITRRDFPCAFINSVETEADKRREKAREHGVTSLLGAMTT